MTQGSTTDATRSGTASSGGAVAERMLIGGDWVDAQDGGTIDVENPARRGSVIATVPRGRAADIDRACAAAAAAFAGWRATPPRNRGLALLRGALAHAAPSCRASQPSRRTAAARVARRKSIVLTLTFVFASGGMMRW